MERLRVPLIRQEPHSIECGLACLAMVYSYFEIEKSLDDVKREVATFSVGTYAPQLGLHLILDGFDVEIVTKNPLLVEKEDVTLSQEELLEKFTKKLKSLKGKERTNELALVYFVAFMEAGGRLKVGIPSLEDLKEETEQGRPVVVFLTNASLYPNNIARVYKRPFTYTFHSLVVTGVTKDEVFVNDPYWGEEGGEKAYPSDE